MRSYTCPSCGAQLNIEDNNRDFVFCQFCGSKIMMDDYRSTQRIIDEARIKQAETDKEIRMRELSLKEEQHHRNSQLQKFLIYIWLGAVVIVLFLCLYAFFTGGDMGYIHAFLCAAYVGGPVVGGGGYFIFKVLPDRESNQELIRHGGIAFPNSVFPYSEKSYVAVESILDSAGFTNITAINLHDVSLGILQKPGLVESITVNGEHISSGNKIFMPGVKIVISYHGK